MCWPSALYRVALLPDNYGLSLPVGFYHWTQPLKQPPNSDGKGQMVFTRWNECLYCILPADGPHGAVGPSIYLVGTPHTRVFHYRHKLCKILNVLEGEVYVVVAMLRQAWRVEQELWKVTHTSQRRQWTGVTLFYTLSYSLSTTLVVFGQSLVRTAGTAYKRLSSWEWCAGTNIGHCPFYTDCPEMIDVYSWNRDTSSSVPTTHIYLTSKRGTSVDGLSFGKSSCHIGFHNNQVNIDEVPRVRIFAK